VPTPETQRTQASRRGAARALAARALACVLAVPLVAAAPFHALADGAGDPARVLEQLRQKRAQQQEGEQRQFATLLKSGKTLLDQHAYEQAERVLAKAAALRPADEGCARLLAQARRAGKPASSDALLAQAKKRQHYRNDALVRQLRMSLFEAEKALKAGDPERARQHAERVAEGVSYVRGDEQAAALRGRAEAIVAQAAAATQTARAAELQAVVSAHKQRAATDKSARLNELRETGWRQLDAGNHAEALAAAEEMLRSDPGNKQAVFLRKEAQRTGGQKDELATLREKRKDAAKDILQRQIEEEMVVDDGVRASIVLAAKHDPRRAGSLRERSMALWEQRIRSKLKDQIDIEFKNATVSDVCRYLSGVSGCTIMVDPTVARNPKRFDLPKMSMSLQHVLHWMCRLCHVSYSLRDHAILVTTRGGVLDEPEMKEYDISGLIVPVRSVKTTFNGASQVEEKNAQRDMLGMLQPQTGGTGGEALSEDDLGEGWVRFIRSTVASETWLDASGEAVLQEAAPQRTIQYRNGRIVVVHTPEVHEQVERLLDDFRKARNLQVHILTRFILIDMDFLESVDVDFGVDEAPLADDGVPATYGYVSEPNDPFLATPGVAEEPWSIIGSLLTDSQVGALASGVTTAGAFNLTYAYLSDDAVNVFVQAILKRRKGSVLMAPQLTCFNTQRANFQAVTNFNYVRRLDADGEPEIGNVPEGIIFDVQPFVSADRRQITLVLQPQMRTLINRTFQSQDEAFIYAFGITRMVNLPETELRSIATTVTVPDGGTILVGGLANTREKSGMGGVPFISGIPLIRYLFREWRETERRESLIILAKAEIVPDIFED